MLDHPRKSDAHKCGAGVCRTVGSPCLRARGQTVRGRLVLLERMVDALAEELAARAGAANPMTVPAITTIGSPRSNASSPQTVSSQLALLARKEEWAEAYRRTPHGSPVTLSAPPQDAAG